MIDKSLCDYANDKIDVDCSPKGGPVKSYSTLVLIDVRGIDDIQHHLTSWRFVGQNLAEYCG